MSCVLKPTQINHNGNKTQHCYATIYFQKQMDMDLPRVGSGSGIVACFVIANACPIIQQSRGHVKLMEAARNTANINTSM